MRKVEIIIAVLVTVSIALTAGIIRSKREYNNTVFTYEVIVAQKDKDISLLQANNEVLKAELDLRNEASTVDRHICDFSEEEVELLARCVEAEAGVGNLKSQKYVTQVILNRLHSRKFPNTLEEVIYQKLGNVPQFSVAYDGAMDRELSPRTLANVYSVLLHGTDLPEYVLFFYSSSVRGNWVNTLNKYTTVEGTVFAYSEKG